jgi:hypothetical protein
MEVLGSSEVLVSIHQNTPCYIQDSSLQDHFSEKIKSGLKPED